MFRRSRVLAWVACVAVSSGALLVKAQGEAAAQPNPERGKKLFYTCYGCHGVETYKNAYPDYNVPKLRHQYAAYIVSALHEYQSGARPHPTMHAQAASLSDQDIEDIAAYLQGGEPATPTAAVAGAAPKQIAACTACHGENGSGVAAPLDPKPPILAGQYVSYLEQALTAYHNGRRKNIVMGGMAQTLVSPDDIKIAAAYFASQTSPLETASIGSK